MNKIVLLVLATFFSLSCNFTYKKDAIKVQALKYTHRFSFIIDDGGYDSYNSNKEELKRCFQDYPFYKSYRIHLTFNEKRRIEDLFNKVDFLNIPEEFKIDPHSRDGYIVISPSFTSSIIMYKGNVYKKVMLNMEDLGKPIFFKEKAYKYEELNDSIWDIICTKEEYKKIPKSDCVYL